MKNENFEKVARLKRRCEVAYHKIWQKMQWGEEVPDEDLWNYLLLGRKFEASLDQLNSIQKSEQEHNPNVN